jgi:hypothetical protein
VSLLPAVRDALGADAEVLTSVEKVQRLIAAVKTIPPTDAKMAIALLALRQLLPMVQLPDDPAELDTMLDELIELIGVMKSDAVPA